MRFDRLIPLVLLLVTTTSAHAFGIGVRAGSTGVGADVAWKVAPTLSARVGYSALSWSRDVDTDRVSYDGTLKLGNLNTFLDFSPLGPFRLTGGLVFNRNRIDLRGDLAGGSVTGQVKSGRSAAPYLGIGYGNVSGLGVNLYADLGIMFQGSPNATLNANCGGLSPGQCASLQNEARAEEARLRDEVKRFKYYPVLNIGLTVGF